MPSPGAEDARSKGSTGLVLVNRVVGAALQVGVVVVVARFVDAKALGGYLAFSASVRLLGTAGSFGHPWYALRAIAQWDELGDPARSRLVFLGSARAVGRNLAAVSALAIPIAIVVAARGTLGKEALLLGTLGMLSTAGYAYIDLGVDALKARSLTHWGLLLDFSVVPLFVISWAFIAELMGADASIAQLAAAHTIGTVVSAAAAFALLGRDHRRRFGTTAGAARVDRDVVLPKRERRILLSFGMTSLLTTAAPNLPQMLLPLVMSLADVGRIGAAIRLTSVPGVLIVGLSSVFAPRFARLAVVQDRQGIQNALRESQRWVIGLYLPFAIAFIVVPERLVQLLGPDFTETATALRILGIGQLVNAITGLAPMLLTMCNTETYVMVATGASVVAMGGASLVLGARAGVVGAAAGYAATVASRNVLIYLKAIQVIRRGALVSKTTSVNAEAVGQKAESRGVVDG